MKVTAVFDTFWTFAAERQAIFWRRLDGVPPPWTEDPILMRYSFTNAYRVLDRASQFLIRSVIGPDPVESGYATLLYKIFNKPEVWPLLQSEMPSTELARARSEGRTIFSGAYVMPPGRSGAPKHETWLRWLDQRRKEHLIERLIAARSAQEAVQILRMQPLVGPFLAYQWFTDLCYGSTLCFEEHALCIPGPGAKRGLARCFVGSPPSMDAIADRQQDEFARRGLQFRPLPGRPLQLIDIQNLFCEVDKYARIAHPQPHGPQRIKRTYHPTGRPVTVVLPSGWQSPVPRSAAR